MRTDIKNTTEVFKFVLSYSLMDTHCLTLPPAYLGTAGRFSGPPSSSLQLAAACVYTIPSSYWSTAFLMFLLPKPLNILPVACICWMKMGPPCIHSYGVWFVTDDAGFLINNQKGTRATWGNSVWHVYMQMQVAVWEVGGCSDIDWAALPLMACYGICGFICVTS